MTRFESGAQMYFNAKIGGLFAIGGSAAAMCFEPLVSAKQLNGMPFKAVASIAAVNVLLVLWNIRMYVKAGHIEDPRFPAPAYERYGLAVASTTGWLIGFVSLLVAFMK